MPPATRAGRRNLERSVFPVGRGRTLTWRASETPIRSAAWAWLALLLVAAAVRAWDLGASSLWFDEVVTMRLAKAPTVAALIDLLSQIDATRAPLHPVLLHGWLAIWGDSDVAGRSLSVVVGVATVGLLVALGRLAFDRATGLWAGWLGAFSPMLVYYARETRMYAPLVLVSAVCWTLLFWSRRSGPTWWRTAAYALSLAAAILAHPLALLMAPALALASAVDARGFFGSWRGWLLAHLAALLSPALWLPNYFDHPPEYLTGPLPIKFLVGTPIGFLGGNFLVLGALVGLVGFGLARRNQAAEGGDWVAPAALGLWLVLPPTLLYVYSRVASPIFGPARYTVYVAPAYLVLVAQGLAKLPKVGRWGAGLAIFGMSIAMLGPLVYDPFLKTDWRSLARALARSDESAAVLVASDNQRGAEVETARYYLGPARVVLPFDDDNLDALRGEPGRPILLAMGFRTWFRLGRKVQERIEAEFTRAAEYPTDDPLVFRYRGPEVREAPPLEDSETYSREAPEPETPANPARD